MNGYNVYTIDIEEFKTGGVKKYTDCKGRTYPVRDAEFAEEVKAYALKNHVTYEIALIQLSKERGGLK